MFGSSLEPDLKLVSLFLNEEQVICSGCESGDHLWLELGGRRETWPAWFGCYCGHGEDHQVITNGLVEAAMLTRTGRQTATDTDTFAAEWRGITLVGECVPTFVIGDAVAVVKELTKVGKKEVRRRSRSWWRGTKQAATGQAGRAMGGAKAAALSAAWQAQTGGTSTARKPRRCRVKGCRRGLVTITTRIHSTTGKTETTKVPCGACHRSQT